MKRLIASLTPTILLANALVASPVLAASITNTDPETVVLTIVEDGDRTEFTLEPGGISDVCPDGCFLTLPNGDRIGLSGDEDVEIINGGGLVK